MFISVWTQGYLFYVLSRVTQSKNYVIYFVAKYSSFIWELFTGGSLSDPRHCVWGGGGKSVCLNASLLSGRQDTPYIRNIPCLHYKSISQGDLVSIVIKDLGTKFNKIFLKPFFCFIRGFWKLWIILLQFYCKFWYFIVPICKKSFLVENFCLYSLWSLLF